MVVLRCRAGLAQAEANLGSAYCEGKVFSRTSKKEGGVKWFQLAAEQRMVKIQSALGDAYFRGEDVPKDYKQALK